MIESPPGKTRKPRRNGDLERKVLDRQADVDVVTVFLLGALCFCNVLVPFDFSQHKASSCRSSMGVLPGYDPSVDDVLV